ncbi:uncharacterized protein [Henckelia pumila]|uniref:uncharacterized protein isoform X1 n=1 Tax=Henckelia pumila TaxID=405737 RepID=UPI003C6DBFBC
MTGHGDESNHGSVGGRWGDQDDCEHRRGHHHHRHDERRHFSMNRFMKISPKPLVGGESPKDAENCLERMENCFREFHCTEKQKIETLNFLVEGHARKWWRFVHPKNILSTVLESLQEGLCFDIQSKENSFESFGFEPGEKLIKVEDARPSRRGS